MYERWKPHNMIKQRLGSTGHWSWLMLEEGMLGVFMGQCTSEAKRCRITLNLMSFSFVIRTRGGWSWQPKQVARKEKEKD